MILTREQIDVIESRASFGSEGRLWSMQSVCDAVPDLAAMARAYHDLRDAVLGDVEWVTTHGSPDGPAWLTSAMEAAYALGYHDGAARIGEVVARVERAS